MAGKPTADLAEKVEALERRVAELEAAADRRDAGRRIERAMEALPAPPLNNGP